MGDSHGANRRLTGYGPIRLLCAVLGVFRTIFASCFSLLLPLMVVFIAVLLVAGFLSACFAPIGPCVFFVEGYVSSESLAFRKAGCAATFRFSPSSRSLALDFNSPSHPDSARLGLSLCSPSCSPPPHHLEGGGSSAGQVASIPGSGQSISDPANPTRIVCHLNGTVHSGVLHVPRCLESTCTPGFSVGPAWSPNFWAGRSTYWNWPDRIWRQWPEVFII